MATFQKRGKSWRAIVRRKGKTLTATFDTRAEAEQWASRIEYEILNGVEPRQAAVQVKSEGDTLAALFARYGTEVSPSKKGWRWEQVRLNKLARDYPVFSKPVADITGPDIADWRNKRLREVSPYTVNRELNLISSVFKHAIREWRVGITVNPVHLVSRPKNPRPRKQRVSSAERNKIVRHLGWCGTRQPENSKQWVAFAFSLALETAMRKGEITSLLWSDVHLDERYVYLRCTKNEDDREVPLSSAALHLLKLLKPGHPSSRVIGVSSGNLDKLFREVRLELGMMHIRFHDARREAATTMAPKLSNVLELSAITGHRSLRTLMVYYQPKPGELAEKLG